MSHAEARRRLVVMADCTESGHGLIGMLGVLTPQPRRQGHVLWFAMLWRRSFADSLMEGIMHGPACEDNARCCQSGMIARGRGTGR